MNLLLIYQFARAFTLGKRPKKPKTQVNKISTDILVQNLKTCTTHLIKSQGKNFNDFSWQNGYGVFSVGKSHLEIVSNYVNNQKEHHRVNSFEEEWNWFKKMNVCA